MRNKTIICIVILCEVLCIAYLFPRKGVPAQDPIGRKLSKICLNARDPFQAYERANYLISDHGFQSGLFDIMFFADIKPRSGKDYIVYFDPPPKRRDGFFLLNPGGKIEIYIKNLNKFKEFRSALNALEEFYDELDSLYDIGRNGYRP